MIREALAAAAACSCFFLCKSYFQFYSDYFFPTNLVPKTPLLTCPTCSSSQFTPCWSCTHLALKKGGGVGDKAHWVTPTQQHMLFLPLGCSFLLLTPPTWRKSQSST